MDNGFKYKTDFNFESNFKFSVDFLNKHKNRYINPKPFKKIPEHKLYFNNAVKLAKEINVKEGEKYHVILSGNFIMGDFIEAFIQSKNIKTKKLSISTLSLNQNNIDSLANLLIHNFVDSIDLIISDYFFAHERSQLIPYLLDKLDIKDSLNLGVAGSHTKICIFESINKRKYIISGSANLRSSGCLEQITIEENKELYDFYLLHHNNIISEYNIINKSIRGNKLWQVVAAVKAEEVKAEDQKQDQEDQEKVIHRGIHQVIHHYKNQ